MAHSHLKTYLAVYFALLLLVVLTVGVAHVPTGNLAFPIAMSIALVKAVLIVAIFMHLKDEAPLIRIFAVAGVFWVGLLLTILMSDYLTREDTKPLQSDAAYAKAIDEAEHKAHVETLPEAINAADEQ